MIRYIGTSVGALIILGFAFGLATLARPAEAGARTICQEAFVFTGSDVNLVVLPYVLMFVVLYFLILRPQMKKQKSQQKMIDQLKKGAKIVTSGGIFGIITNLKDDVITVKIADNVRVEMSRSAVSRVRDDDDSGGDSKS